MPDQPSHYFDEHPETPSAPARVEVVLADIRLSLTTDRGVFGHARLDPGTRLLLQEAPAPPPHGDLLDLGCGYGAIALTMALRAPGATVWAVDVNERARRLCADNARSHSVRNVRVCAPDEVPAEVRFTAIWSNPPIRIGKAALHDLLLRWLARLDGEAVLVVHRHLGSDSLQRWLDSEGYPTTRLVSRAGYRLLVARV